MPRNTGRFNWALETQQTDCIDILQGNLNKTKLNQPKSATQQLVSWYIEDQIMKDLDG